MSKSEKGKDTTLSTHFTTQRQSQPRKGLVGRRKNHPLLPIRRKNSLAQNRPHRLLPLIPQTITPEIARQNAFQILRLNRSNERPGQNIYLCRINAQDIETAFHHFERPVLFDGSVAGPEEVES